MTESRASVAWKRTASLGSGIKLTTMSNSLSATWPVSLPTQITSLYSISPYEVPTTPSGRNPSKLAFSAKTLSLVYSNVSFAVYL